MVIIATGSEVSLALDSVSSLQSKGYDVRVVSMPCRELFMLNTEQYIQSVLPAEVPTLSLEAGVTQGWTGFSNSISSAIGLNRFGASAPGAVVAKKALG